MKYHVQKTEGKDSEYWIHADYRPEQTEGFSQESVVFYSTSEKAFEFLSKLCETASNE